MTDLVPELFRLLDEHNRLHDDQISDRALGVRAGASQSLIAQWRDGRHRPSLHHFDRVLRVLGYRLRIERLPDA